jgi:hypothetical protein
LRGEGTGPIDDRLKRLESALGEYARRLDRMIGAIRRKRHREALEETAKLAGRVLFRIQRIRSSVRANRWSAARAELFGLSRWKVLKGEPLYAEVPGLCHAAAQALFRRDRERAESWIEVLEQRAVFARRWPRILERFTDFWLDAPPGNRVLHERIAPFFERVVSGLPEYSGPRRVRERAALWALTIQWFRISRRDEPERGESAAFRAASAYRRILGYPDISGLFAASWFGSKRYRFARTYLGELHRETLLREDLEGLARALAEDFRLDPETASLLLECVRVEPRPGNLADQAAGAYKTSRRAA